MADSGAEPFPLSESLSGISAVGNPQRLFSRARLDEQARSGQVGWELGGRGMGLPLRNKQCRPEASKACARLEGGGGPERSPLNLLGLYLAGGGDEWEQVLCLWLSAAPFQLLG